MQIELNVIMEENINNTFSKIVLVASRWDNFIKEKRNIEQLKINGHKKRIINSIVFEKNVSQILPIFILPVEGGCQ